MVSPLGSASRRMPFLETYGRTSATLELPVNCVMRGWACVSNDCMTGPWQCSMSTSCKGRPQACSIRSVWGTGGGEGASG